MNHEGGSADSPSNAENPPSRSWKRFIVPTAIGLVLLSVVWALRAPSGPRTEANAVAPDTLTLETIPLVTGDESIVAIFTKPGCPVCHQIPGIPGGNGQVGPPLILGATGVQRLTNPDYRGQAKTVREYIVESVLEPQRFVVPGYPGNTMPTWYGARLSALALEKMATYLEHQGEEYVSP